MLLILSPDDGRSRRHAARVGRTVAVRRRGVGRRGERAEGGGSEHRTERGARDRRRPAALRCRRVVANFWQNFARFRLYRRRSLQANMRFAAFFKINQIV